MRFPPFNPYMGVIIGVFALSFTSVLVKLADHAPAAIIANYRLLIAFIIMIPIIVIKYRHEFRLIQKKDWISSIISGLFLASFFVVWFESLQHTSVASSVVLKTLQPILAFLGTYIFVKERFSPGVIISIFIALFGSSIIMFGDLQLDGMIFFGDMLALISAILVTIYYVVGLKVRRRLSLIIYTFIVYGIGSIALIIYNIAEQNAFTNYPISHWWIFIVIAIVPTFFGHALFNWALKWINASYIGMGNVFESIVAAFLAFIILKEQITSSQWLGGTIIIFGLFLFTVSTSRKRRVTISEKGN